MKSKEISIDYGIDAPAIIRQMSLMGLFNCIVVVFFYTMSWLQSVQQFLIDYPIVRFVWYGFMLLFLIGSIIFFLMAGAMYASSKIGKYKQRNRLLNLIHWRGDEMVLDVGCGRGLLLIGAAQQLITGKAVGIDIWQEADLSDNTKQAVLNNIKKLDLSKKVEIKDADARRMPFSDESFDVIVSSMVIHNIRDKQGRIKALSEIVRVLKPGGTVVLQDFRHTKEYADVLKAYGMKEVKRSGLQWYMFPPVRIVKATKKNRT